MFIYKGVKCAYLTLNRWKIQWKGWHFDIICRGGIRELMDNIDRWQRYDN